MLPHVKNLNAGTLKVIASLLIVAMLGAWVLPDKIRLNAAGVMRVRSDNSLTVLIPDFAMPVRIAFS